MIALDADNNIVALPGKYLKFKSTESAQNFIKMLVQISDFVDKEEFCKESSNEEEGKGS